MPEVILLETGAHANNILAILKGLKNIVFTSISLLFIRQRKNICELLFLDLGLEIWHLFG